MSKTDSANSALEHVDASRRGFLGKLLSGGATVAALPVMSTVVLGDDRPTGGAKGKGRKGKGDAGKGGKGKGGRPDAATMAARMIQAHDGDGDGALNLKELTAAIEALMSRRGKGKGGPGGGKGKGGPGGGKGKGGKGKGGPGGGRGRASN